MKYLERAYPWLLGAPVILPVVIWGSLIYPYLVPKTLLFYAISCGTLATFILLAAHGRKFFYHRLSSWIARVPMALLAVAYIASWSGIDLYQSFWSLLIRGDGLLMLTCAVSSFYLILLYVDQTFFERLLRAVAIVSSFVAVYGIGEWLFSGGRIGGLLGNAAFFAGYLTVSFFITLAAARSLTGGWARTARISALLQVVAVVLSATRGSILALVLVGIVALAYLAWRGKGKKRSWSAGILVVMVALGGLFLAFRAEFANSSFEPVARVASIGVKDPDIASRLFIWKNMIGQVQQSPWLGVGAEHIDVLFNRFYDPTQIEEQWFDRAHNAFLDYFAQYGVFGFLLYLALIGSFFVAAWRLMRRGEEVYAAVFALLALAYAAQNFFVFDTISSFWLLLAVLAALLGATSEAAEPEACTVPAWMRYGAWPAALVLVLLIIPFSVRPALAAYDISEAYKYQLIDVQKEVNYLSHGIALGTYANLEYGYEAYDMYVNYQAPTLTGEDKSNAYHAALAILTANFNRYSYDARTALYLAHVLSLAPVDVPVDDKALAAALERTMRLSPNRAQPWFILVNLSLADANTHPAGSAERLAGYAAAHDLLSKYISRVPKLSESHFVLAQLDRAMGDTAAAAQEAALGKSYYVRDLETSRRAAGYYEGVQDWINAKFFLEQIVMLAPTDYASLYDLAKVTYLSDGPAAAEAIVETIRTKAPAILPTDQNFFAAITAYEQSKK